MRKTDSGLDTAPEPGVAAAQVSKYAAPDRVGWQGHEVTGLRGRDSSSRATVRGHAFKMKEVTMRGRDPACASGQLWHLQLWPS